MLSFDLIKPWENLQTEKDEEEYPTELETPAIKLLSKTEEQINNPEILDIEFTSTLELTADDITYLKEHTTITLYDSKETKILALDSLEISDGSWLARLNETNGLWIYQLQLDVSAQNLNVL